MNGAWGILALGLFSNGVYGQGLNGIPYGVTGLFYGDSGQLVASVIGIAVNVLYVGSVAALAFFIIGKVVGNRVPLEDEVNGLDLPEMGVLGYSNDGGPLPAGAGHPPSGGSSVVVSAAKVLPSL